MSQSNGLTLITLTGGRPEAFALCEHFVRRQTWNGPLQWIVVNDVDPSGPVKWAARGLSVVNYIYPEPKWRPGQNTMARNLLAAIPEVRYDKILFVEDDDAYAPDYLEAMAAQLDVADIAGEMHARYYHVGRRLHLTCPNIHHASMCATGMTAALLPALRTICQQARGLSPYLDIHLWQAARGMRKSLTETHRVIGIKGLPGRPGIGMGHKPETHLSEWTPDPELHTLRKWIGEDADLYGGYHA